MRTILADLSYAIFPFIILYFFYSLFFAVSLLFFLSLSHSVFLSFYFFFGTVFSCFFLDILLFDLHNVLRFFIASAFIAVKNYRLWFTYTTSFILSGVAFFRSSSFKLFTFRFLLVQHKHKDKTKNRTKRDFAA